MIDRLFDYVDEKDPKADLKDLLVICCISQRIIST